MKNIKKYMKYGAVALLFVIIIGIIAFSDRAPKVDPLTAQIEAQEAAKKAEIDMLVHHIQSGSTLWAQAANREKVWHDERIRQEQGNAGYRHTLCTKFQKIVTASGTVIDAQLSTDGSSCIAVMGF